MSVRTIYKKSAAHAASLPNLFISSRWSPVFVLLPELTNIAPASTNYDPSDTLCTSSTVSCCLILCLCTIASCCCLQKVIGKLSVIVNSNAQVLVWRVDEVVEEEDVSDSGPDRPSTPSADEFYSAR